MAKRQKQQQHDLDDTDPLAEYAMTKEMRERLARGEFDSGPPDNLLLLEVFSRTGPSCGEDICELCAEICDRCGSIEKAIEALRSGAVQLERTGPQGAFFWSGMMATTAHKMLEPTGARIEEAMLEAEALGLFERVRDEHGNVVTKPGVDGKPQILWRRTAKILPSTEFKKVLANSEPSTHGGKVDMPIAPRNVC